MPQPTLTQQQIDALTALKTQKTAKQATLSSLASAQDAIIAQLQTADSAFQQLFAWYNDSIIGKYDAERKSLDGYYIASPVQESDITSVGAVPPSGRLAPTPPAVDIVRISEFDGGPLVHTSTNEEQHIADQTPIETQLTTGFGGTDPIIHATTVTDASFGVAGSSLQIRDTVTACTFAIGNQFPINDGTTAALVQVTSVTDNTVVPGTAPFLYTLGVTVLIPAAGTIASGSAVKTDWHGFTNAERTTKTAAFAPYQIFMNTLVARLQVPINARIARLNEQIPAITANDDPYQTANNAQALTNANAGKNFLVNYLITTDVSNTGLLNLSLERGGRSTYITTRLAQILAAYTGGTVNFYNARYNTANNRGNTQRGTLREQQNAANVKTQLQSLATGESAAIAAYNSILP